MLHVEMYKYNMNVINNLYVITRVSTINVYIVYL